MKTTLTIKGMHCASCEMLLTDVLEEVEGVKSASVSQKEGTAVVEHDGHVKVEQLRKAVEAEGYKAE